MSDRDFHVWKKHSLLFNYKCRGWRVEMETKEVHLNPIPYKVTIYQKHRAEGRSKKRRHGPLLGFYELHPRAPDSFKYIKCL